MSVLSYLKTAQQDEKSTALGTTVGGLAGLAGGNAAANPIARAGAARSFDLFLQALRERPVTTTPDGVEVFAAKGSPMVQKLLQQSRMAGAKGSLLSLLTVLGLTGAGAYGGHKIQQSLQQPKTAALKDAYARGFAAKCAAAKIDSARLKTALHPGG